jgi:hypothetical protein
MEEWKEAERKRSGVWSRLTLKEKQTMDGQFFEHLEKYDKDTEKAVKSLSSKLEGKLQKDEAKDKYSTS